MSQGAKETGERGWKGQDRRKTEWKMGSGLCRTEMKKRLSVGNKLKIKKIFIIIYARRRRKKSGVRWRHPPRELESKKHKNIIYYT